MMSKHWKLVFYLKNLNKIDQIDLELWNYVHVLMNCVLVATNNAHQFLSVIEGLSGSILLILIKTYVQRQFVTHGNNLSISKIARNLVFNR